MTLTHRGSAAVRTPREVALGTLWALLLAASVVGGLIGGALAVRLVPAEQPLTALAAVPAPTFDSVGFRAEERRGLPAPTFDAPGYRSEEHQPLVP